VGRQRGCCARTFTSSKHRYGPYGVFVVSNRFVALAGVTSIGW
jgi:hypothetical protein